MQRFSLVLRIGFRFGFGLESLLQKDLFSILNQICVRYRIRIRFGKIFEFRTTVEDDLYVFQMEDDHYVFQMKDDLYFCQIEDDINYFSNGIQLKLFSNGR